MRTTTTTTGECECEVDVVVEGTKDKYGSRIWLRWGSRGAVRCGAIAVPGRWLLGRYAESTATTSTAQV
jgi:hypothetical protein